MQWMKLQGIILVFELLGSSAFCGEVGIMHGMTVAHNKVRAEVGLPGLSWSDDLALVAEEWAGYLARENGCILKHRPPHGEYSKVYGENLYWAGAVKLRSSSGNTELSDISPVKVVQSWAGEVGNYSYAINSCTKGKACGHYTQIVWKQTVKIGCARAVCADKSQVWVCNYDPAGNLVGQKPY